MAKRHWSETDKRGWLEQYGLRLLEGNYNNHFGVIDLIMTDGDNVAFFEVRQHISSRLRTPAETMNKQKHQRPQKTAIHRPQQIHWGNVTPYRFDVNTIEGGLANDWIKNAF